MIVAIFGGGVIAGAAVFVDPKVKALRVELTQTINTTNAELTALRDETRTSVKRTESTTKALNDRIEEKGDRIAGSVERIAGMEVALGATSDRVDRLHIQVTKNSEEIVELKVRGTPGPPD